MTNTNETSTIDEMMADPNSSVFKLQSRLDNIDVEGFFGVWNNIDEMLNAAIEYLSILKELEAIYKAEQPENLENYIMSPLGDTSGDSEEEPCNEFEEKLKLASAYMYDLIHGMLYEADELSVISTLIHRAGKLIETINLIKDTEPKLIEHAKSGGKSTYFINGELSWEGEFVGSREEAVKEYIISFLEENEDVDIHFPTMMFVKTELHFIYSDNRQLENHEVTVNKTDGKISIMITNTKSINTTESHKNKGKSSRELTTTEMLEMAETGRRLKIATENARRERAGLS